MARSGWERFDSYLLAKPDAVRRGLVDDAVVAMAVQGVTVVGAHEVQLDRRRILELWPRMIGYHIGLEMVAWYFSHGPALLLPVIGVDAVEATRIVKVAMRRRHGDKILGSLFHSPDSSDDGEREWALVRHWNTAPDNDGWPTGPLPPCWKQLDALGVDVDDAVRTVRGLLKSYGAGQFEPVLSAVGVGDYSTIVADDPDATPDSILAGLLAVRPGLPHAVALSCVVQVDLLDGARVFSGDLDECQEMAERLRAEGLGAVSVRAARPPSTMPDAVDIGGRRLGA